MYKHTCARELSLFIGLVWSLLVGFLCLFLFVCFPFLRLVSSAIVSHCAGGKRKRDRSTELWEEEAGCSTHCWRAAEFAHFYVITLVFLFGNNSFTNRNISNVKNVNTKKPKHKLKTNQTKRPNFFWTMKCDILILKDWGSSFIAVS